MLTQQDGARLMAAAKKWADAKRSEGWIAAGTSSNEKFEAACRAVVTAERTFAELVAKLADSEGL